MPGGLKQLENITKSDLSYGLYAKRYATELIQQIGIKNVCTIRHNGDIGKIFTIFIPANVKLCDIKYLDITIGQTTYLHISFDLLLKLSKYSFDGNTHCIKPNSHLLNFSNHTDKFYDGIPFVKLTLEEVKLTLVSTFEFDFEVFVQFKFIKDNLLEVQPQTYIINPIETVSIECGQFAKIKLPFKSLSTGLLIETSTKIKSLLVQLEGYDLFLELDEKTLNAFMPKIHDNLYWLSFNGNQDWDTKFDGCGIDFGIAQNVHLCIIFDNLPSQNIVVHSVSHNVVMIDNGVAKLN
jgi:hypothetical protein